MLENDLSGKKLLHSYHSAFFKLFHIPLDWVSSSNKTFTVCGNEHCHPLCARIMEHESGACLCRRLTEKRIAACRKDRKAYITRCHAGFYDMLIPIFDDQDYLGSLCIGQFLREIPSGPELESIARTLNFLHVTPTELEGYYRKTRIFSDEQVEGLHEMLSLIADSLCENYGRGKFLEAVSHTSKITVAEKYIQKHYASKMTIEGISRAVGMSKSYFIHEFSRQVGQSPVSYINAYRIARAVELMQTSNLNISEVAFAVGFQNLSHFYRMYRKISGKNPRLDRLKSTKMG